MKQKLIADSGSTKTDWRLTGGTGSGVSFQSRGMNPFFRSAGDLYEELNDLFPSSMRDQVGEIHYYGAGMVQGKDKPVRDALSLLFPGAVIEIRSDILGAARALFGNCPGIACIMGTGSNACFYDGREITARVPPLGFILGDECSGSDLGKKLLGDYFKGIMPERVSKLFEKRYQPVQLEVLDRVYRKEQTNRYLAGYAPFLASLPDDPYCRGTVTGRFREFMDRNVMQIPEVSGQPIGFAGSVAWHFREIILPLCASYGFTEPVLLKNPVDNLAAFHTKV
ncbi:MAG: hypothetical protein AB7D05_00895 [Mangrovibacterium sp.]